MKPANDPPMPDQLCRGILHRAEAQPDAVGLKGSGGHGDSYSYRQIAQIMQQLAGTLRAQSPESGERIGLLSENRPEWRIGLFGDFGRWYDCCTD